MKIPIQLIWLLLLLGLSTSCNLILEDPPPDINDPRVIREAQRRLNNYRQTKKKGCIEDIIVDAEIHVDTTLAKIIDRYISDTLYFPNKPQRPEATTKIPVDSTFRAVPIFTQAELDSLRQLKKKRPPLPDTTSISTLPDTIRRDTIIPDTLSQE